MAFVRLKCRQKERIVLQSFFKVDSCNAPFCGEARNYECDSPKSATLSLIPLPKPSDNFGVGDIFADLKILEVSQVQGLVIHS